ncbi:MAG: hypothetical protein HY043_09455 [Verrucomicrobia bacterium]|nr:hypothetical protein [Verrucomicrobiota bacterium]
MATKRVGQDGSLEIEFGKVNGKAVWLDRTLWMLIGFQIWMVISQVCSIAESATGRGIGQLATQRSKYDELHRTFVNTHGPGLREYALNVLVLFITPLALALVTAIVWKCLLKSEGRARTALTSWLAKPAKLALSLFVLSLSFQVFTSCFQVFDMSPKLDAQNFGWWSWYVAAACLRYLPACGICASMVAIFARKRLRASQA